MPNSEWPFCSFLNRDSHEPTFWKKNDAQGFNKTAATDSVMQTDGSETQRHIKKKHNKICANNGVDAQRLRKDNIINLPKWLVYYSQFIVFFSVFYYDLVCN